MATSLAPVFLTYWFARQVAAYNGLQSFWANVTANWHKGIEFLVITTLLVSLCHLILNTAKKRLEELPVSIEEIKSADNQTLGFILVYLLPLANSTSTQISVPLVVFIGLLFFMVVLTSNSYHFNPLLSFLNYHFYEVKVTGGVTHVLISRKNITNSKSIRIVFQLTEYMILEKT